MKTFFSIVGIGVLVVISVLVFKACNVTSGLVNKTVNSESIIQNYEWFYDMKNQIDATRMKYKIAKEGNMTEANGIKMVLMSMVGEYNARSKQINRNLWKAKELPYQINFEE